MNRLAEGAERSVEKLAGFVSGNYSFLFIVDYERSQEFLSLA
jgi:hypothetical protein